MNLRILKKLSKQAVPLLKHFRHRGDVFLAKKGENYLNGLCITARKHWDRSRSVHADCFGEREIKRPARDGRGWVYMHPPYHPLKGTPMVGAMEGYYEPEWEERTTLEELADCVRWHDKPASMTDAEWQRALRITQTSPVTEEEMAAWAADAEPCDDCGEHACVCADAED